MTVAQRATPESYFKTSQNVQDATARNVEFQVPMVVDTNVLAVLGLVAIVSIIGLFAVVVASQNKKCER